MLEAKTKNNSLEKNNYSGDKRQKDLSRFKVAIHQIAPLILVIITGILSPFATIYAQPTGNLEAKYYSTHNRYTNFSTFGGTVIEARTWERINTRNYNLEAEEITGLLIFKVIFTFLRTVLTHFEHYLMTEFGLR